MQSLSSDWFITVFGGLTLKDLLRSGCQLHIRQNLEAISCLHPGVPSWLVKPSWPRLSITSYILSSWPQPPAQVSFCCRPLVLLPGRRNVRSGIFVSSVDPWLSHSKHLRYSCKPVGDICTQQWQVDNMQWQLEDYSRVLTSSCISCSFVPAVTMAVPQHLLSCMSQSGTTITEVTDNQPRVELEDSGLWNKFQSLTNEMIVTKNGRRMFPVIKVWKLFSKYSFQLVSWESKDNGFINSVQPISWCEYWSHESTCDLVTTIQIYNRLITGIWSLEIWQFIVLK